MTLPSEEYYTLTEKVPKFLRYLIALRAKDVKIRDLRRMAASCLHHYPFKIHIDDMYDARGVCEHGKDKQWCEECE